MNIAEAIREAEKKDGWITRGLWLKEGPLLRIKPTDEPEGCIVQWMGHRMEQSWQPQAEDLVAEDWIPD